MKRLFWALSKIHGFKCEFSLNLPVRSGPTKALDKCKYCIGYSGWQCWQKIIPKTISYTYVEKKKNLLHFKFTDHLNVLKTFTLIFIASIRRISILY